MDEFGEFKNNPFKISWKRRQPEIDSEIKKEGSKPRRYLEVKRPEAVDFGLESIMEESEALKMESSDDFNLRSGAEPHESSKKEMEGLETISSDDDFDDYGDACEENNNHSCAKEFQRQKGGQNIAVKNKTIEIESFNRFYLKCQENAKKWITESHGINSDDEKKKKIKAQYFEDTRNWEFHINRLKSALTETYIKGKEDKSKFKIYQKNSNVEETSDSENDENTLREKALSSINISTIQKKREDDLEKVALEGKAAVEDTNSRETEERMNQHFIKNSTQEISQDALATVALKNEVSIPEVIKHLPPNEQEHISMEMRIQPEKSEEPKDFHKTSILPELKESEEKRSEYSKDFNEFTNFVEKVENELKEYLQYKEDVGRMRKEFSLMQNKMFSKKRHLILNKLNVDKKNEKISKKLAEISEKLKGQGHCRDSEMLALKLREVNLRSQITSHNILKEIPESREILMTKISTPSPSRKRTVSVSNCDKLDPSIPLCPFDLNGLCNDDECKYQHVRRS